MCCSGRDLGACSSQTMTTSDSSLTLPSACVATLGQPWWSQKYSVSTSSRPSAVVRPVLIVTCGMVNPLTQWFSHSDLYQALAQGLLRPCEPMFHGFWRQVRNSRSQQPELSFVTVVHGKPARVASLSEKPDNDRSSQRLAAECSVVFSCHGEANRGRLQS